MSKIVNKSVINGIKWRPKTCIGILRKWNFFKKHVHVYYLELNSDNFQIIVCIAYQPSITKCLRNWLLPTKSVQNDIINISSRCIYSSNKKIGIYKGIYWDMFHNFHILMNLLILVFKITMTIITQSNEKSRFVVWLRFRNFSRNKTKYLKNNYTLW